jgi:hypothetical protein
MYEYANFSNTNNNDLKNLSNSNMTFAFGREIDLNKNNPNTNIQILNDRDMFNKFSNTNETIDTTSFNLTDSYGMPIQGGSTSNNKKSLLSTPYIMETNNKNNWVATTTSWNPEASFAELKQDKNKFNQNAEYIGAGKDFNNNYEREQNSLEMAWNNNLTGLDVNGDNGLCKIEMDCLGFEYELTKQKQKDIVVDVSSPFALGYVWKTLILLSKNPSTDKFVKMLGIKNKDTIIMDMKRHAEVFEDSGKLEISIPVNSTGQTPNTNYIDKIESIYKISIVPDYQTDANISRIKLDWNFLLELPFFYQPKVVIDYLIGYTKAKTKFLELTDVPIFLLVDKIKNIVCVEIPCSSNMTLGFIYTPTRQLVQSIQYDLITQTKKPMVLAKKLIIPKLSRSKKSIYSKNFKDVLNQVHLGEVIYGTLYQVEILMSMSLSIGVSKEIPKNTYEINKTFDEITINHECFYYIKNDFLPNKILSTGMIRYT